MDKFWRSIILGVSWFLVFGFWFLVFGFWFLENNEQIVGCGDESHKISRI